MTEKNTTYRASSEVFDRIKDFVDNASPALLQEMANASVALNGKARGHRASPELQFLDYAVWLVFNPKEKGGSTVGTSPRFGLRIEQDVQEIMAANRAAYAADPTAWENLTAIGSTLLRDKGHNPVSLRKWLADHREEIDAHHAEIGITDPLNHNRKAGKARSLRK